MLMVVAGLAFYAISLLLDMCELTGFRVSFRSSIFFINSEPLLVPFFWLLANLIIEIPKSFIYWRCWKNKCRKTGTPKRHRSWLGANRPRVKKVTFDKLDFSRMNKLQKRPVAPRINWSPYAASQSILLVRCARSCLSASTSYPQS